MNIDRALERHLVSYGSFSIQNCMLVIDCVLLSQSRSFLELVSNKLFLRSSSFQMNKRANRLSSFQARTFLVLKCFKTK